MCGCSGDVDGPWFRLPVLDSPCLALPHQRRLHLVVLAPRTGTSLSFWGLKDRVDGSGLSCSSAPRLAVGRLPPILTQGFLRPY